MADQVMPCLPFSFDRRAFARVAATDYANRVRLRVLPGVDTSIIDLSSGGAAIELATRLLPGTAVEVLIEYPGQRVACRARVVRSRVEALPAGGGVRYVAALSFQEPLEIGDVRFEPEAGEATRQSGYLIPAAGEAEVPARAPTTRVERPNPSRIERNAPGSAE
jgi:hypothetical protein